MGEQFVTLNADNIDDHHLCCALGDPKHEAGVEAKKAWLRQRFEEGLVFRKLDVRGKVFIEYAPAEVAWRPIVAPGWLVIHCLWVSGRFAKHGHATTLVDDALADAAERDRHGLVVASGRSKRPFLSDPKWLARRGFVETDAVGEWRLWALPVGRELPDDDRPRFADRFRAANDPAGIPDGGGSEHQPFLAVWDDQCPFNLHWTEQVAESLRSRGHEVETVHVTDGEQARNARSPLGTFGLERNGRLVCHHLTTDAATERLLAKFD